MSCNLCPNKCNAERNKIPGACGVSDKIRIAKYYLHPFEEPEISGKNGSGTVFFCGCSLKCVFCQNYDISRNIRGKDITVKELAQIFRELIDSGAHNINLVSPTHFSNKIAEALEIYRPNVPVIYNTHGYESVDVLKKIDKYIDVYLPDIKFYSPEVSLRYCGKSDYFEKASEAVMFMANKQLIFGNDGLIKSGTIVRHLVLPMNVSDSKNIISWFTRIKDKAYINVMSQYTPFGNIEKYTELKRKITKREYDSVINYAISLGIENMYYQKMQSATDVYIPKWDY